MLASSWTYSAKARTLEESRIPVVERRLNKENRKSTVLIMVRLLALAALFAMNLGISGTEITRREVQTRQSYLEERYISDGLVIEDPSEPYAQMDNSVIGRCFRSNLTGAFTVYRPVFNLTEGGASSVTKLIVKRGSGLCTDGTELIERELLVTGMELDDETDPMEQGAGFKLSAGGIDLDLKPLGVGEVTRVDALERMDGGAFRNGAHFLHGYCVSLAGTNIQGSDEPGQAVRCLFYFRMEDYIAFSVKQTWLNNIILDGSRVFMRMGTQGSALAINLGNRSERADLKGLASKLLVYEPTSDAAERAGIILKFYYSAVLGSNGKTFRVASGVMRATSITRSAV